jgi:thioesterase domain-containing protein
VLGRSLPLATLFQAPTIEKLAAVLRDRGWVAPWSCLVPIHASGTRPPFFFVHAIGGNVVNFAGFAEHFGSDQPVYALQARGLNGKEPPNLVLEKMAADYIREIQTVQPEGPYYIGGFSAGAVVAFEMARQLNAIGEQVPLLALLEGEMECARTSARAMHWWRTILFNARYAAQLGLANFVVKKFRNWRRRAHIRFLPWRENPSLLDAEEAFMVAMRNYTAGPYEGSAILFCTESELRVHPDLYEGWVQFVRGGVEVQMISGDHETLLAEPQVGMLAAVLEERLMRTRGLSNRFGLTYKMDMDTSRAAYE